MAIIYPKVISAKSDARRKVFSCFDITPLSWTIRCALRLPVIYSTGSKS